MSKGDAIAGYVSVIASIHPDWQSAVEEQQEEPAAPKVEKPYEVKDACLSIQSMMRRFVSLREEENLAAHDHAATHIQGNFRRKQAKATLEVQRAVALKLEHDKADGMNTIWVALQQGVQISLFEKSRKKVQRVLWLDEEGTRLYLHTEKVDNPQPDCYVGVYLRDIAKVCCRANRTVDMYVAVRWCSFSDIVWFGTSTSTSRLSTARRRTRSECSARRTCRQWRSAFPSSPPNAPWR
jgi:hypothetical protein